MKKLLNEKIPIIILIMLLFSVFCVDAQSLYVRYNSGAQTEYSIENISKLSFESGNLLITDISGSSDTFVIEELRYINFTDLTTIISQGTEDNNNLKIYPLPATDKINFEYISSHPEIVSVSIVTLDGKLIYNTDFHVANGINCLKIDISKILYGMYICRLTSPKETLSSKIIKQ